MQYTLNIRIFLILALRRICVIYQSLQSFILLLLRLVQQEQITLKQRYFIALLLTLLNVFILQLYSLYSQTIQILYTLNSLILISYLYRRYYTSSLLVLQLIKVQQKAYTKYIKAYTFVSYSFISLSSLAQKITFFTISSQLIEISLL